MKFVLLLSLISISSITFASEIASQADIVQAIKDSIANKDLDCIQSDKKTYKASSIDFDVLVNNGFVMTINENEQPLLTFTLVTDTEEDIVKIATNSDLTSIESIKSVSNVFKKEKVNTGTIIRPHYEEKTVKKFDSSIECK